MRTQLGWLTFLLAIGFAGGLVLTLVGNFCSNISDENALIGFFGFGVPLILTGLGTSALWSDKEPLLKTFGWTSTVMGFACGVGLFILVAVWVLGDNKTKRSQPIATTTSSTPQELSFGLFYGFGIPMVLCGGYGIAVLLAAEEKRPSV